jgi:hypothetical protein
MSYLNRKSIRLKGYDYSWPGWYFVTIATGGMDCFFGNIVGGAMNLSPLGEIADRMWKEVPNHHANVKLDVHQVMPNHIHGIVILGHDTGFGRDVHVDSRRDVQLNVPPLEQLNVPPEQCTNVPLGINFPSDAQLYDPRKKRSIGRGISPAKESLSVIIRTYKAAVTTWARRNGFPEFQWQGRFYE